MACGHENIHLCVEKKVTAESMFTSGNVLIGVTSAPQFIERKQPLEGVVFCIPYGVGRYFIWLPVIYYSRTEGYLSCYVTETIIYPFPFSCCTSGLLSLLPTLLSPLPFLSHILRCECCYSYLVKRYRLRSHIDWKFLLRRSKFFRGWFLAFSYSGLFNGAVQWLSR